MPDFDDDDDDDSGASSSHPLQPLMERLGAGRGGSIDPNDLNNVLRGTKFFMLFFSLTKFLF